MSAPVLKYCLVALLSQDSNTQTSEKNALIADDFLSTQLAACMREYGESPEKAEEILIDMSVFRFEEGQQLAAAEPLVSELTSPTQPKSQADSEVIAARSAPSQPSPPKKPNVSAKSDATQCSSQKLNKGGSHIEIGVMKALTGAVQPDPV